MYKYNLDETDRKILMTTEDKNHKKAADNFIAESY